ncbi:hypothetical protein BKA67DRAFT_535476 [Truncatella angustata]|uniref:F-box domain-containing protein n=1 Tax=Truncatella angustata TaxID=152316 RepID=A0A9P8ULG0_9PEZI|nr:uncharacterized protein BKA67DRAFT_535476 [Truncatella angustata]KAH6654142.1 hypothetical protein BKA67DRAFT_535476 [Truncatella angustata]
MTTLPLEILQLICSFIKPKYVGKFRLASKTFSDVGAKFMFREIKFLLHVDDLNQLQHISERYPNYVRSLVYSCKPTKEDLPLEESQGWHAGSVVSSARRRRVAPSVDLVKEYHRNAVALETQRTVIRNEVDFRRLSTVFANLRRLQSVMITRDGCFLEKVYLSRRKTPFDQLMPALCGETENNGCRQLEVVLFALQNAAAELETFRAGAIGLFFIANSKTLAEKWPPSCSRLKQL